MKSPPSTPAIPHTPPPTVVIVHPTALILVPCPSCLPGMYECVRVGGWVWGWVWVCVCVCVCVGVCVWVCVREREREKKREREDVGVGVGVHEGVCMCVHEGVCGLRTHKVPIVHE